MPRPLDEVVHRNREECVFASPLGDSSTEGRKVSSTFKNRSSDRAFRPLLANFLHRFGKSVAVGIDASISKTLEEKADIVRGYAKAVQAKQLLADRKISKCRRNADHT